ILDEPTTGLHLADVGNLLRLLDGLADSGRTVIVIEHHQAVMAHADHIIDLGPGAGHDGGSIVFEGSPAALVTGAKANGSVTAKQLAAGVNAGSGCADASAAVRGESVECVVVRSPDCSGLGAGELLSLRLRSVSVEAIRMANSWPRVQIRQLIRYGV